MKLPGSAASEYIDQNFVTFQQRLAAANLPRDTVGSVIDSGIARTGLSLHGIARLAIPDIDELASRMTSEILEDYSWEGREAYLSSTGLAYVVASILEPKQLPTLTREDFGTPEEEFNPYKLMRIAEFYRERSPGLIQVFESSRDYCDRSGSKSSHAYLGFFATMMTIEKALLFRTAYAASDMLEAKEEKYIKRSFETLIGLDFPAGQDRRCYNQAITQQVEDFLSRIAEPPVD